MDASEKELREFSSNSRDNTRVSFGTISIVKFLFFSRPIILPLFILVPSIIHNNLRKTFALFIYNFSLIDLIINYYFSSKSLTTRPTISRKFPFYSVNGLRTRIARRRERREEKFPRGNVREVFSCVRQNVVRDHVGGERERESPLCSQNAVLVGSGWILSETRW